MKHLSVASVLVMKRGDKLHMGFRPPIYQLRWRNDAVRVRSVACDSGGLALPEGRYLEPIPLG